MELHQLRYFLCVADSRSFVSAASSLYVSRQAVSKAVSRLEEELGVELFMRDSSGAYLTPVGVMFYERIRSAVMELDDICDQLRSVGPRYRQRIRVAFSIGILPLVEERMRQYHRSTENVELSYAEYPEAECLRLLEEHQADLFIGTAPPNRPWAVCEELYRSRLGLLLRSSSAPEDPEPLELRDLNWIPLAGHTDSCIQSFCKQNGLYLQYQGYDYNRLFDLAASGKCGLLLPECLIPQENPLLHWQALSSEDYWTLYQVYPQALESNSLFSDVLDDFHAQVLRHIDRQ